MKADEFKERLAGIGWKQADFARASGITPASVSGWAKGHVPIPEWADSYLGMAETLRDIIAAFREEPRSKVVEMAERRLADAVRSKPLSDD